MHSTSDDVFVLVGITLTWEHGILDLIFFKVLYYYISIKETNYTKQKVLYLY